MLNIFVETNKLHTTNPINGQKVISRKRTVPKVNMTINNMTLNCDSQILRVWSILIVSKTAIVPSSSLNFLFPSLPTSFLYRFTFRWAVHQPLEIMSNPNSPRTTVVWYWYQRYHVTTPPRISQDQRTSLILLIRESVERFCLNPRKSLYWVWLNNALWDILRSTSSKSFCWLFLYPFRFK